MARPEDVVVELRDMAKTSRQLGNIHTLLQAADEIERLSKLLREVAAEKIEGKCKHEWSGALDPRGGLSGTCRKCGETRHVETR